MKKLISLILIIVTGLTLVAGCTQSSPTSPTTETPPTWPADQMDETGITPLKVWIGNMEPGAENVEYYLTIHNGSDEPAQFSVTFLAAGGTDADTGDTYVAAPPEAESWVIIADPAPVLAPKETRNILIKLVMPEDAEAPADKWEFRIVVKDETQTGMLQIAYACRWLITMK